MQPPDQGATRAGGLLGRDQALTTIAASLADVRSGRRAVVVVDGDAGFGKTSLLRAAFTDADAIVLWAYGDELEREVDHGIIEQLVRAAPPLPQHPSIPLSGDPLQTGAALVRIIDDLSLDPGRPLVVVVDDAQWADAASVRALTFAARRLRRDPVMLVLAVRSNGLDALPRSLLHLADHEGARLHVHALDRDDVRRLAEQCLQVPVTPRAADRLLAHTGGSPLHLRTVLEELPPGAVESSDELPSPRSFATLVLARLAASDPAVESLVTAVAILGEATPLAIAAAVAEVDEPLAVLDEAVARDLLRVVRASNGAGADTVAPAHPLVGAAVLGDLPAARRASLHRRAGAVLDGATGLRHRLRGASGPDRDLWDEAMATAVAEGDRGRHGTAAELARLAATAAPDADAESRSVLEAADQLLHAGRLGDVERLRDRVEAADPSARRSYVQARLAYVVGPRHAAGDLLERAWQQLLGPDQPTAAHDRFCDASDEDRQLAGRVAAALAMVAVDQGRGEPAIGWARAALELAPARAALDSAAHMLAGAYALADRFVEGCRALDELCAAIDPGPAGDPGRADTHAGRGLLAMWSHDLARADSELEASLAAATQGGSFVARESARFYLAELRHRQGRWDEAIDLARVAASIVDDTDQAWLAALPHATAARPLAARGDPAAEEHAARALAAALEVGEGVGIGLARISAMEVAVCRRDFAAAVGIGDGLRLAGGVDDRIAPWRATYVEALVATAQVDTAAAVADELAAAAAGSALIANDAALTAVLVASARRDQSAFEDAAQRGLDLDPDAVGPYPRARLELAVGRGLRRRGERRRAQSLLEVARGRLVALGAIPLVEEADREITALGLRPTRQPPQPGAELTPQERAVAHLVAQGRTNREVAAELIVSAKTVEHHLSRIYAKLGVRSRTELAHRFGPVA